MVSEMGELTEIMQNLRVANVLIQKKSRNIEIQKEWLESKGIDF